MYDTFDLNNFINDNSDNENVSSIIYCENEDCYNNSNKKLFGDYYCRECYPDFTSTKLNTDIVKIIYKQGVDNTYPSIGNRVTIHYKGFIIDNSGEYEFYNTYKNGIKQIILGNEFNLKLFNTVITSMNKGEQSVFLTNMSYINFINDKENDKENNKENDKEINFDKFKFEIEVVDIHTPVFFTKKIII